MLIIVPANNKGGVGKTKISIILAEYYSYIKNKRVLAIDFDSQCNFSERFIKMDIDPASQHGKYPPIHPDYDPDDPETAEWNGRSSIADIFFGGPLMPYPTHFENLDILPAHASQLLKAEEKHPLELTQDIEQALRRFLWETSVVRENYDVVIIDTAPSKGPLTIGAIKSASHMLIPSVMEEQPVSGIYGMLQLWMQESAKREKDHPLELIGILPNLFRQTTLHKGFLESLKENEAINQYVMPCTIGQRTVFAELDTENASPRCLFDLPDSNPAKQEAIEMCEFVEKRVRGE